MMYLLFNNKGELIKKNINEIVVQGSNNVNKIGVAIQGVDPTAYSISGICKLPNGEIVSLEPNEEDEIIDGINGVVFYLDQTITCLSGLLRINFQAVSTTTNKVIVSYTVFLNINEGIDPGEILMMTVQQYQDLLSKIEIAKGKCRTLVISYEQTEPYTDFYDINGELHDYADFDDYVSGLTLGNPLFNSNDNQVLPIGNSALWDSQRYFIFISIGNDVTFPPGHYIVVKGTELLSFLKTGDIILVTETDVPKRWILKNGSYGVGYKL